MTVHEKILYCTRSGVPLCKVTKLNRGGWPISGTALGELAHPIYSYSLHKLIAGLEHHLDIIYQEGFKFSTEHEWRKQDLALHISAIMHSIEAIWQPPPGGHTIGSLPSTVVAIGCAPKFLELVTWYHEQTSKRLKFPIYRIHPNNGNMNWENFNGWLEAATAVKIRWESGKDKIMREADIKATEDALLEVRAKSIWKRLDYVKVWNWIDMNLSHGVNESRRAHYRELFLKGDTNPDDYTMHSVDNFMCDVVEYCDLGNEIMFFIRERMNMIRTVIQEFCSGYRLMTDVVSLGGVLNTEAERQEFEKTTATLAHITGDVTQLTELPPQPVRSNFKSFALFLQAQARWNITKREWDKQQANAATAVAVSQPVSQIVSPSADIKDIL